MRASGGRRSSVSVRIASSATEYGVCDFKKQTSRGGRGEKREIVCECVFLCAQRLFAEGICHRSPFLGCRDHSYDSRWSRF